MAKTNVTEEKVSMAADYLLEMGKNINAATVRQEIGGGSNSTIQPHLNNWNDKREQKIGKQASKIPEELTAIALKNLDYLWGRFLRLESEKMEMVKLAADSKVAKSREEIDDTWRVVKDLEQQIANVKSEKEEAERKCNEYAMRQSEALGREKQVLADCAGQIQEAKAQTRLEQEKCEELRTEVVELRSQLAVANNSVALFEHELDRARGELDELRAMLAYSTETGHSFQSKLDSRSVATRGACQNFCVKEVIRR